MLLGLVQWCMGCQCPDSNNISVMNYCILLVIKLIINNLAFYAHWIYINNNFSSYR